MKEEEFDEKDLVASFQKSVVDVLVKKTMKATLEKDLVKQYYMAGGVAANSASTRKNEK